MAYPRYLSMVSWIILVLHHTKWTRASLTQPGPPHPSRRTLYYLHTTPATWRSARDTCAGYGAHLVHNKDTPTLRAEVSVLTNYLGWYQLFPIPQYGRVWSGLVYNLADDRAFWDACEPFDKAQVSDDVEITATMISDNTKCAAIDTPEILSSSQHCEDKLPYICQLEEGECWFLPVDNKQLIDSNLITEYNLDVETCAQKCREMDVDLNGAECWGFTYTTAGLCQLYMSEVRHSPLLYFDNILGDFAGNTAFLKICIGGAVTAMGPVVPDAPTDQSCTGVSTAGDEWTDGLCFCECDIPPAVLAPSELILTLDQQIQAIIKRLLVDPADTSAAYRKLNSVHDDRESASSIGTAGVAFICLLIGAVVVLDMHTILCHVTACLTRTPENLMAPSHKA